VVTKQHCLHKSISMYKILSWISRKFLAVGEISEQEIKDVHSFQFLLYKETVSTSIRVEKGEFHITKT